MLVLVVACGADGGEAAVVCVCVLWHGCGRTWLKAWANKVVEKFWQAYAVMEM